MRRMLSVSACGGGAAGWPASSSDVLGLGMQEASQDHGFLVSWVGPPGATRGTLARPACRPGTVIARLSMPYTPRGERRAEPGAPPPHAAPAPRRAARRRATWG